MMLSNSAQKVQQALLAKGQNCEVIELSQSTRTAMDAANALGCDTAQIIKSLLFCTQNKEPVLILASGINRVNEKTLEKLVGSQITKADANFTKAVTGFAIGGVPPLGHLHTINFIFIDEDLLQYETLWAAAGTPFAVFKFLTKDIEHLTGGKIVCIK
ncbi:MAG: YbaK/EbsC family protein [Proteobacteria bacterium]|nr:YbaK/EbsC family protein [Pseudomonadota bacterium]